MERVIESPETDPRFWEGPSYESGIDPSVVIEGIALERLYQLYRHDLSGVSGQRIGADGRDPATTIGRSVASQHHRHVHKDVGGHHSQRVSQCRRAIQHGVECHRIPLVVGHFGQRVGACGLG